MSNWGLGARLHKTPTRRCSTWSRPWASRSSPPAQGGRLPHDRRRLPAGELHPAHLGSFASGDLSEHLAAIDVARRYPNVYLRPLGRVHRVLRAGGEGTAAREADSAATDRWWTRGSSCTRSDCLLPRDHESKVLSGNLLRRYPLERRPPAGG
ncbi:MAG: hypothetical protein WKF75_07035 [Singulisphaera sp.]